MPGIWHSGSAPWRHVREVSLGVQRVDGRLVFAASDLNDYLECKRLTELELLVALGAAERPECDDPQADLLRRKGEEHERRHLETLHRLHPGDVAEFGRAGSGVEEYLDAQRRTLEAMRAGKHVIYQATFFDGRFIGRADFLMRVPTPTDLGDYGYEVVDTKLGLRTKPYYLVQICNYSEHLHRLQGRLPEFGRVVFGDGAEKRYRLHDYMAYYRHLKASFLDFVERAQRDRIAEPAEYPFERAHCSVCEWNAACERRRRDDDHLSLVAWIRRDQIAKLEEAGIATLTQLARASATGRPAGMRADTFEKLRRQASLQERGRTEPLYELVRHEPPLGFALMPPPAAGDVFFDMEGDPLYEPGRGLEYLFGCWMPDDDTPFRAFWGVDRAAERRAFEAFVDFVTERRRRYPGMHVYHYAGYEKSALRRLAQQHCTREDQVDDLLRGEVLVDLFAVVRQALAISEERYGLKNMERFYDLERATEVKKGDESILMFERWRDERDQAILDDIERYNRDDCRSTQLLRDWLLARRADAMAQFGIDFPPRSDKPYEETVTDADAAARSELERALLDGIPAPQNEQEYVEMSPAVRTRYLLGHLLAYHRREEKPAWWEYFDRFENVDQLLEFDKTAIAGLTFRDDAPVYGEKNSKIYTYSFPDQPHKLSAGDAVENPRTRRRVGTIHSIDDDRNVLELKTTLAQDAARAIAELTPGPPPGTREQRGALARIARSFTATTLAGTHPATYDLLTNADPRVPGRPVLQPNDVTAGAVSEVARALDDSYLFVQGPPGSGKSTIGSRVICDLLADGKRVAVTSNSHKAIHNLLHKVEECMEERGSRFRGLYKCSAGNAESVYTSRSATPCIESVKSNDPFSGADYDLAGGTGWLFAREELTGAFDYLFIDEAGQVSLADALAVSLCARNVVLLGDPSQLSQVSQGRQPPHVGDSVLEHLLGDRQTVPEQRGVFLDVSYRMQPDICAFVSDAMYGDRLRPAAATGMHRIVTPAHELAGLYFAGVDHAGNGSSSPEEADEIVRRVARLLDGGQVVDSQPPERKGVARPLTPHDIIVVTPYNAQRRLVGESLHRAGFHGIEVGTVDKYQGQEAPVVFYSMATSSGDDVPRNVEFLFDRNRFNVAISRARAVSILVCSPRLLDIACRTPDQMALANLLCSFAERATSARAEGRVPA